MSSVFSSRFLSLFSSLLIIFYIGFKNETTSHSHDYLIGTANGSIQLLHQGVKELETGIYQEDKFKERGRKTLEAKEPELLLAIQEIVDGASQTAPKFTSTRLYTRLSAQAVRNQLINRGYKDEDLPSNQTIWNKMHSLGYKRRKVSKTKPKKKNKRDRCYI